MGYSEIFIKTKFIQQSVDKYIADVYGQNIYRIILYKSPRMVYLGKRTALLCIIFVFFNQGGEIKARDLKRR